MYTIGLRSFIMRDLQQGQELGLTSPLTNNYTGVNTAIDSLNALGATETRSALKQAIDLIISKPNSNPKVVKAIILTGNWNGMVFH